MKRSEINRALRELEAMCKKYRCYLPPFCRFTPDEWKTKGHEYDEVRECMLGWDITDYGLGNFDEVGFSLITIRNGSRKHAGEVSRRSTQKSSCILKEGQYSPNHFHWFKTEDIINRGGGNVLIRVYNSKEDESIDYETDVTVHTDGRTYAVPAGTQIRLTPGESIFIYQRLYHDFTVEPGTGRRAARRGQPVQRRQYGQPLQPAHGALSRDRRGRAAVPAFVQRVPGGKVTGKEPGGALLDVVALGELLASTSPQNPRTPTATLPWRPTPAARPVIFSRR